MSNTVIEHNACTHTNNLIFKESTLGSIDWEAIHQSCHENLWLLEQEAAGRSIWGTSLCVISGQPWESMIAGTGGCREVYMGHLSMCYQWAAMRIYDCWNRRLQGGLYGAPLYVLSVGSHENLWLLEQEAAGRSIWGTSLCVISGQQEIRFNSNTNKLQAEWRRKSHCQKFSWLCTL